MILVSWSYHGRTSMAPEKPATALKSVLTQMQKRRCTDQELRDYILKLEEEFYKNTAVGRTSLTRYIQLHLGCSWPAAETVIRWSKNTAKRDASAIPRADEFVGSSET